MKPNLMKPPEMTEEEPPPEVKIEIKPQKKPEMEPMKNLRTRKIGNIAVDDISVDLPMQAIPSPSVPA
jgi:divalent metal cation (Fe/Co/Zn/Cd) transporter